MENKELAGENMKLNSSSTTSDVLRACDMVAGYLIHGPGTQIDYKDGTPEWVKRLREEIVWWCDNYMLTR